MPSPETPNPKSKTNDRDQDKIVRPEMIADSSGKFVGNGDAVTFATSWRDDNANLHRACDAKTHRGIGAWTIKAAIDWQAVGLTQPAAGTTLGLQIVHNRAQSPAELTQWTPTFARNLRPQFFGTLQLE